MYGQLPQVPASLNISQVEFCILTKDIYCSNQRMTGRLPTGMRSYTRNERGGKSVSDIIERVGIRIVIESLVGEDAEIELAGGGLVSVLMTNSSGPARF